MSNASLPWLLTSRETAKAASLTLEQLRMLWAQGRGPEKARRGRFIYVAKSELERWLRARALDPEATQTAKK